MRNLATHANIGEDIAAIEGFADILAKPMPDGDDEEADVREPELDADTREALGQLDPTVTDTDEIEPGAEEDETLVWRGDTPAARTSDEALEHADDLVPEEPDDSVPDALDADEEGLEEAEREDPCA
jgi:hypothetical protein